MRKKYAAIVGFVLALMLFVSLSLSSNDERQSLRDLIPKAIALLVWLSIELILIAKDKRDRRMDEPGQTEEQET